MRNRPFWQFSLLHLFELTTLSAAVAALAVTCGPGTLMTSAGISLAWLNMRGAFENVQSGRRQAAILGLAWVTFLVSLALPSITVFGPVLGFSAAWFSIAGPIESLLRYGQLPLGVIVYLAIDLANVLMLLLPLLIWWQSRGRGQWHGAMLCIAMVAPWCVAWDVSGTSGLLIGYYIWCVSFGIALVAIRIRRQVLVAMLVMTIGLAAVVVLGK